MENTHIFKADGAFYAFDGSTMTAYAFPQSVCSKLENLSVEELSILEKNLLINEKKAEKKKLNLNYCSRLIINISSVCNMACKYCYADEGDYGQENVKKLMDRKTLEEGVQAILKLYPEGVRFIQFFGGEPLLNKSLLFDSVEIINNIFDEKKLTRPSYSMVTNGTLMDDKVIDFIIENFNAITLSLDGEKDINDCNRIFKDNNGSVYDKATDALYRIKKKNPKFFVACEGTITKAHMREYMKTGDISNFYNIMSLGFDSFQMAPVFGCDNDAISLKEFEANDVARYFYDIEKYALKNISGDDNSKPPSNELCMLLDKKTIIGNGCGANCGDICFDVSGDIYPCFMFIGYKDFYIGNAANFDYEKSLAKMHEIKDRIGECNDNKICNACWAKNLCSLSYGHCAGIKQTVNNDISKPVELSCEISKKVLEMYIFKTADAIEETNNHASSR